MIQVLAPARDAALLTLQAPAADPGGSFFAMMVPMAAVLLIFYFLLIRPANKKQKALQAMINDLKNGDKIITTGGIHGVVAGISDEIIQLRVAPNVKIEISRSAVAAMQKEQGE